MSKTIDLQPWLDYFDVLRTYEEKGFLELRHDSGEAYITEAALDVLSNADTFPPEEDDILKGARRLRAYASVLRNIRSYAGWKSQEGKAYLDKPFAMHVMAEGYRHYAKCIILMTVRRRWWRLWRKADYVEVIPITEKKEMS